MQQAPLQRRCTAAAASAPEMSTGEGRHTYAVLEQVPGAVEHALHAARAQVRRCSPHARQQRPVSQPQRELRPGRAGSGRSGSTSALCGVCRAPLQPKRPTCRASIEYTYALAEAAGA